jgi:hypothetical protein
MHHFLRTSRLIPKGCSDSSDTSVKHIGDVLAAQERKNPLARFIGVAVDVEGTEHVPLGIAVESRAVFPIVSSAPPQSLKWPARLLF